MVCQFRLEAEATGRAPVHVGKPPEEQVSQVVLRVAATW